MCQAKKRLIEEVLEETKHGVFLGRPNMLRKEWIRHQETLHREDGNWIFVCYLPLQDSCSSKMPLRGEHTKLILFFALYVFFDMF